VEMVRNRLAAAVLLSFVAVALVGSLAVPYVVFTLTDSERIRIAPVLPIVAGYLGWVIVPGCTFLVLSVKRSSARLAVAFGALMFVLIFLVDGRSIATRSVDRM